MNSSVSSTSQPNNLQPLASDATFTRLNNGSDISSYLYNHQLASNHQAVTSNQAPMNTMMIGRNQLRQQPQASYVRQESIHQPTTTIEGRYFAQPSMSNIHHQIPPLQQPKPPYSALTNTWTSTTATAGQPTNRYNNHHQSLTPVSSVNNAWRSQYYQNNAAKNSWQPQIAAQSYFGRPANNYTPSQYMTATNRMPANMRQYQHANSWQPAVMNHHNQNSPTQYNRNLYSKQSQRSSMGDSESENDSDLDPDPDTDASKQSLEDGQGDEEQPAPSNEQEASVEDEQQQQPDMNKEIEEQNGQRSYSEDESDANERDKDGNLIITHHKHLINGKPVNKEGNSKKKARDKSKRAGGDFEKIANEIEDEGNQDRSDYDDVANGQQQTDESRRRQKLIEPSSSGLVNLDRPTLGPNKTMNRDALESRLDLVRHQARNKTDGSKHLIKHAKRGVKKNKKSKQTVEDEIDEVDPLSKKGKELHDHQLRESLTAQQWDDDSTSPNINENNKKTKIDNQADGGEQLESLGSSDGSDDNDNKQSENPSEGNKNEDINTKEEMEAEGETGPQQVEADFKDLDLISDPEKFMHSDKRRKRQADTSAPDSGIERTNTTHLSDTSDNLKQLDDLATNNVSKLYTNQSVPEVSPNEIDFDDATNISNVTDVSPPRIGNNTKLEGVDEDGVSGQEDTNHEMAANPPQPDDGNNPGEQQTNQAVSINILPPPMHQNDPQASNGADAYMKFYDGQSDQPGFVSYPTNIQDVPPSPNTFYQNGHSNGPYDVPPPQFYPDHDIQPNQELQQQQYQPRPTPLLGPPPQEGVEYTNQLVDHVIDQMIDTNSQLDQDKPSNEVDYNPLASGSKSKSKKLKKKKKFKKSKLTESKRKAAHAETLKKKSKSKKGKSFARYQLRAQQALPHLSYIDDIYP